jgi:hypothetical protein
MFAALIRFAFQKANIFSEMKISKLKSAKGGTALYAITVVEQTRR